MISFLDFNYINMITYYLLIAINFLKKLIGKNYLKSGPLVQGSKTNQICRFFRTSACPRALARQVFLGAKSVQTPISLCPASSDLASSV
jgi:hypothetical protein